MCYNLQSLAAKLAVRSNVTAASLDGWYLRDAVPKQRPQQQQQHDESYAFSKFVKKREPPGIVGEGRFGRSGVSDFDRHWT